MGLLRALEGPPEHFTLDRVTYHLDAGCWGVLATMQGDWTVRVLLDLLDDDGHHQMLDALEDDRVSPDDLRPVAVALAEAATGRIWWQAAHLYGVCESSLWPELNGKLIMAGQDAVELAKHRPSALLDGIYALLVEGLDSKQRDSLDQRLRMPPVGAAAAAPLWDAEDEGSAFMAAMASRPGRKGAAAPAG